MKKPNVLILHATGTNRDVETAWAIEQAGGIPEIVHVNRLRQQPDRMQDFQMLIIPGGFSYGDALGAGRLLASDLRWLFQDQMARFIEAGKPVLGICNGFQALVKSGWLPGPPEDGIQATLTRNASNHFECRWVWLDPNPDSPCIFTKDLTQRIYCPVAHGEGRFVPQDDTTLTMLKAQHRIALTYAGQNGGPAGYPANPNGSVEDIAGICNQSGTVMGLMPHPEDHVIPQQHPRHTRGESGELGLALFIEGVKYAGRV